MNDKAVLKGHKVVIIDDVVEWGKQFEGMDRRVNETTLPDGKWVSTVFLGLNYAFFDESKPQWFETMVFDGEKKEIKLMKSKYTLEHGESIDQDRYETWEEAKEGHKQMVLKWTNKGKTND